MTRPDATAVHAMLVNEQAHFVTTHPLSRSSYYAGEQHYLHGAPSHWMQRRAGGFPLYVRAPSGARAGATRTLEALLHVYLMNRRVLITPFPSMLLISPATTGQDIAECEAAIAKFCQQLARTSAIEAAG